MSEDLTGRRLGHYRIDGVLGKGGMSVMYRATDVRLGRKVALKVIGEHLTGDAEFRERFVDEARNTSAIDHSNVVPLYDFGEVDGLLYIAMRLVDGADLATLVKSGPLNPRRAIDLLDQVGAALDMLHGRGLVHLDVKPANVLVTTKESSSEHVYLADFGLTRRGATGHRTRTGDFLGSPTYAAPEHLRGEPVDARTDVYSLACVLFACLSGRPPFTGSVQDVIAGHLNKEVPALSSVGSTPPALDDVIRKGMAKDPKARYASCRELITAARSALASAGRPGAPGGGPPGGGSPGNQPVGVGSSHGPASGGGSPTGAPFAGTRTPSPYQSAQQGISEPVRLRPPVPAGTPAFAGKPHRKPAPWVLPVILGALAVIAVVVIILVVNSGSDNGNGGGGGNNGGNNGGGNSSATTTPSHTDRKLPTFIPTPHH